MKSTSPQIGKTPPVGALIRYRHAGEWEYARIDSSDPKLRVILGRKPPVGKNLCLTVKWVGDEAIVRQISQVRGVLTVSNWRKKT